MNKKIAISILHHKKAKLTVACLESLKKQSYDNWHVYLLIQGASQEDKITLHNLYDDWDKITIIESEKNRGFAEGNNILIRKALKDPDVEYIVTLNNDITVEPDFLTNIIKPFLQNQGQSLSARTVLNKIGMVQARMMKMNEPKQVDSLGIELTVSGLSFNIKSEDKTLFCPSAGAACYSRELLDKTRQEKQTSIGFESRIVYDYFDSYYFAYAEDLDLGFRSLHSGFKPALANDAVCYHLGSATTSKMSDLAVFHTYRNVIFTIYKNFPIWWLVKFGLFLIIGQKLMFINFTRKNQMTVYLTALKDGFKYLKKFKEHRHNIQTNSQITTKELESFLTKKLIDWDYL